MDSLKLDAIKKYLSGIDFKTDNWSIHQISQDMKKFLGETPAIDIIYKKDVMVTELTGEAKEFKKIEKVKIIFTDTDDKIKKFEILL
jgi:hypothetical protein